jgi:polar amino acid transport system substrate-binding protein
MAGMTVNPDRQKEVDFSTSYANGVQAIIVPEDSAITTVDDLYAEGAAYKVGVQLGTTGDTYSTDDFGKELVTQYANGNEAVMALKGGSVDCVIIDNEPAKALVAANAGLKILETSYADEDYAICVKKGNTELLDKINTAIDELTTEGKIDEIISKYIK